MGVMATAYESSSGDLAERMPRALEVGEAEGGDIRGKQSAAILVVGGNNTGKSRAERMFDLRVEDNPAPIKELQRLVTPQRVYLKLNEGDHHLETGKIDAALEAYKTAIALVPDAATQGEVAFWVGVTLADLGHLEDAIPYLVLANRQHNRWADLIPRLPASGLLPDDVALFDS